MSPPAAEEKSNVYGGLGAGVGYDTRDAGGVRWRNTVLK